MAATGAPTAVALRPTATTRHRARRNTLPRPTATGLNSHRRSILSGSHSAGHRSRAADSTTRTSASRRRTVLMPHPAPSPPASAEVLAWPNLRLRSATKIFLRPLARFTVGAPAGAEGHGGAPLRRRDDQAVALRRRRLCHPVAAVVDPVELARLPLRDWPRTWRERQVLGADVAIDITPMTSATPSSRSSASSAASRRPMAGPRLPGRGAVEPVSARGRPRARSFAPPASRSRSAGFTSSGCLAMLPELPPDIAAAQRSRHHAVRRRGRGPARRGVRRRARRPAEADLQLHERPARPAASRSRRSCRSRSSARYSETSAPSTPGAAARSSAASARSSTCRGASRAGATPTTSSGWCAPTSRRASTGSSSPTTISPATAIGRRSSTG